MKFQYFKKNIQSLFLLVLVILIGCSDNETESLFDDNSTSRTENKIDELRELLKSSTDGWRFVYYPNENNAGGFTFNMRFKDDSIVEMISDQSTNTTPVESEYSIELGASVSLVFSSSNGLLDQLVNNTLKGEMEFIYYGQDGNDIVFRSGRTGKEIRFSKITSDDWTNFNLIQNMFVNMQGLNRSVFRTLKIGSDVYSFSYDNYTRFANSNFADFGIRFSETGIIVNPGLDLGNGIVVTNFEYDSITGQFVASDSSGNELAVMDYSNIPITPLTGYQDLTDFFDMNYFFGFAPILDNATFTNNFDVVIANMAASGVNVTRIVLLDLNETSGNLALVTNLGNFFYSFDKSVVDNKLLLTRTQPANVNDAFFAPILDLFFDPMGIYVERVGTLDGFSNQTFTFVPASDTRMRFSFFTR